MGDGGREGERERGRMGEREKGRKGESWLIEFVRLLPVVNRKLDFSVPPNIDAMGCVTTS